MAVALESLQLSMARALSPCVAKSPMTVCTLPATLRIRSYLILTISVGREVGNVSNSSSSSSGLRKPSIHVGRVPGPEPVVPQPNHKQVEENCGQDQLRVADKYQEQDVHKNRCQWVSPVADAIQPSTDGRNPREKRHYPVEVCLASPKAPHVDVHIQHVLNYLPPERWLCSGQSCCNNLHCLVTEPIHVSQRYGLRIMHFWK
ncbi:hypothetical protein RJ639_015475 [Escallonia herrerae]|uniref:Uncharacterized protein n=1 Tax=Escallonia herrerae TaxID=1293975 RepID=A0AA89AMY8_9ASTE|nr:hypothetical protein RJ639_015475 [Escallonia herrerae]